MVAAAFDAMAAAAGPSWPVTWLLALAAAVVAAALALPRPPFFLRLGSHFFSVVVSAGETVALTQAATFSDTSSWSCSGGSHVALVSSNPH